jgi:hypothetical protein
MSIVFVLGFLATVFLVIDISFVFWYAIRVGGVVTLGESMDVLIMELFIVVPLSFIWMIMFLMQRRWNSRSGDVIG